MRIDVKVNTQGLDNLGKDLVALATRRALHRTIDSVRVQARRAMAADTGLRQKDVDAAMRVHHPTLGNLRATLEVTGKRIPVAAFGARQTKKGVTYNLGQGRRLLAGAFIPKLRSGHEGVFKRRGRKRLPIRELFGPSLPRVFVAEKIRRALEQHAAQLFEKNLTHEIAFRTTGRGAGGGA